MEPDMAVSPKINAPFKLLLFIDKRPHSSEQIRQIRYHLKELMSRELMNKNQISLEIVDVTHQPDLAEHFKLVATPALVKVSADQHQTLTGSDITTQLAYWWPRWQREIEEFDAATAAGRQADDDSRSVTVDAVAQSTEILRLCDDIFRLEQEKENLISQLTFKDHIIAMMAHDLRNPLTAASIALETLELAYDLSNQRAEKVTPKLTAHLIKITKAQIRTINSMITDILQAARGSSASLEVTPAQLDLQMLCSQVTNSFQAKLNHKKQSLETDIPQDLPFVYADANQVQRVLTNLIDNAIKYTPAHGKIGITALHRTNEKVQVSIRDTGPGIPRNNQKVIFEESFRLKRDQSEDGYGLGLALCQQIVRAHYGQIWVDSKNGEGSCFHFTLPVYKG